jgi:hypothetical protein
LFSSPLRPPLFMMWKELYEETEHRFVCEREKSELVCRSPTHNNKARKRAEENINETISTKNGKAIKKGKEKKREKNCEAFVSFGREGECGKKGKAEQQQLFEGGEPSIESFDLMAVNTKFGNFLVLRVRMPSRMKMASLGHTLQQL